MQFSQAAENNKTAIAELLVPALERASRLLEIGSGTGQHAVYFSSLLPRISWQPSDLSENLESLNVRLKAEGGANILPAMMLNVMSSDWSVEPVDAIYSANSVHIMSWSHVEALFAGVDKVLKPNGILVLYGPFKYGGEFTTPSNAQFELWLKARDANSGIRDFEAVDALANEVGLKIFADHPMPANNQLIIWQRN